MRWPFGMRWLLRVWNWLFLESGPVRTDAGQSVQWNRGAYLVQAVAHCGACHTPRGTLMAEKGLDERSRHFLAGASVEGWASTNLRGDPRTGLGGWSREDIAEYLHTGRNAHATSFGPMSEVIASSTQFMTRPDLDAVALYLKSVPGARSDETPYVYDASTADTLAQGRFDATGARQYAEFCMPCHGANGKGFARVFPPLAGNPTVVDPDPSSLANLLLDGAVTAHVGTAATDYHMPGYGWTLDNQELANVLTFIRAGWGNHASRVNEAAIAARRAALLQAAERGVGYPPALTGLRGNHAGTYTLAHSLAREGAKYPAVMAREVYDLVVVGGGLSGLAAAWFYQRRFGAGKRILILDNHDDFGGHAKRNEFTVRGQKLVTYGGSAEMPPSALDSRAVATLLAGLGVDAKRHQAAERDPYRELGMGRSVFFDQEHFGRDQLLAGDPFAGLIDARNGTGTQGTGTQPADAVAFKAFLDKAPLPRQDRAALARLADGGTDYLAGMSDGERLAYLKRTSYAAFLREKAGLGLDGQRFLRSRSNDAYALDADGVSVFDALAIGLPAGKNMPPPSLNPRLGKSPASKLWFADGNATLARLLVQSLIPGVASTASPDAIGAASFDYSRLDTEDAKVKVRLNSTAIAIEPDQRITRVTYGWNGNLHRVEAAHVVLAGYNMMIPFIMPGLPDAQKQALRSDVKAPVVYTKVALDNWRAFEALKTSRIHAPAMAYTDLWLEKPAGARPADPVVLHMLYVPTVPDSGMQARERFRAGRAFLLGTPFAELERGVRSQLGRMLAPGGFAGKDVIRGITVNRWAHGYSYMPNSLFEDEAAAQAVLDRSRAHAGNVVIANSDCAGSPSLTSAIDQAWRAVGELPG
ncbi:c-type cytochrome [Cupriavidus basilensis]